MKKYNYKNVYMYIRGILGNLTIHVIHPSIIQTCSKANLVAECLALTGDIVYVKNLHTLHLVFTKKQVGMSIIHSECEI